MLYIAERDTEFLSALKIWAETAPYSKFPSQTISWRLIPAFLNRRLLILADPTPVGFFTWGWMTNKEFDSREYLGQEVFSRTESDRLVVVDAIITRSVRKMVRHIREYFAAHFPTVTQVYAHRGPRVGRFHNIRGGL